MRKRISCIIALLVMMTASGCGSQKNMEQVDTSPNTTNTKPVDNMNTPQPTTTVTPPPTTAPKPQPTTTTTTTVTKPKPTTTTPKPPTTVTKPNPSPTIAKPSTTPPVKPPIEVVKVAVSDIMNKITKEVELFSMMNLKKEEMEDFYYINSDDVEDFIIKVPMMNVKATEIAIIKVKDIKNVETVKESINKRVKDLERTWERYLPDQYELVKNHILKSDGQYVIFIISEDAKKIEGTFDSFFKK